MRTEWKNIDIEKLPFIPASCVFISLHDIICTQLGLPLLVESASSSHYDSFCTTLSLCRISAWSNFHVCFDILRTFFYISSILMWPFGLFFSKRPDYQEWMRKRSRLIQKPFLIDFYPKIGLQGKIRSIYNIFNFRALFHQASRWSRKRNRIILKQFPIDSSCQNWFIEWFLTNLEHFRFSDSFSSRKPMIKIETSDHSQTISNWFLMSKLV